MKFAAAVVDFADAQFVGVRMSGNLDDFGHNNIGQPGAFNCYAVNFVSEHCQLVRECLRVKIRIYPLA